MLFVSFVTLRPRHLYMYYINYTSNKIRLTWLPRGRRTEPSPGSFAQVRDSYKLEDAIDGYPRDMPDSVCLQTVVSRPLHVARLTGTKRHA